MQQSEAVAPAAAVEEVTAPGAPAADALASAPPAWSEEEVGAMKVAELKVALESLGLETDGKKAVLATRLIEALKASVPRQRSSPPPRLKRRFRRRRRSGEPSAGWLRPSLPSRRLRRVRSARRRPRRHRRSRRLRSGVPNAGSRSQRPLLPPASPAHAGKSSAAEPRSK